MEHIFENCYRYQNHVVKLFQALRGKTINSNLWQRVDVEGRQGKWYSDRDDHWEVFRVNNAPVHVLFRAYFTGTDDNIEYIITKQPHVQEQRENSLNVLVYNIYMRTGPFYNGQKERALILKKELLRPWDIIIFSEAFDDDIRDILYGGLRKQFPYKSTILGSERGIEEDGGVIVFSRWPISVDKQMLFGDVCSGSDCMADKGVKYIEIKKNGRKYHLFATHTNANNDADDIKAKEKQFFLIRKFVDQQNIPKTEPVIIGGDLNVDKFKHPSQYNSMHKILNTAPPEFSGLKYSYSPEINDLADSAPSELLDYVFVRKDHLMPMKYNNKVQLIRSSSGWKEFFYETTMYDLSDHFPVEGDFSFLQMATFYPYKPQPVLKAELKATPKSPKDDISVEECVIYARQAVAQQQSNLKNFCAQSGPEWNLDYDAHLNWCRHGNNRTLIESSLKKRRTQLEKCNVDERGEMLSQAKFAQESFCRSYAGSAVFQQDLNVKKSCGFVGLGWSNDVNGHYQWCMFVKNKGQVISEGKRRASLLKSCR